MLKVALRCRRPIVNHDAADTAQGEKRNLLSRLRVWTEVFGGNSRAINQLFVCIHTVEYNHRPAVVEDT